MRKEKGEESLYIPDSASRQENCIHSSLCWSTAEIFASPNLTLFDVGLSFASCTVLCLDSQDLSSKPNG